MIPALTTGQKKLVAGAGATIIFVLMAMTIADTAPWQEAGAGYSESFDALATALFTDHVIALEVLGILLTAAMIGAMVIAHPMEGRDDKENYATVSNETMEQTQHLADEGATFVVTPLEEEE